MRRRLFVLLALLLTFPGAARAAKVLVLTPGHGVSLRSDPFLPSREEPLPPSPSTGRTPRPLTPATATARAASAQHRRRNKPKPQPKPPSVPQALAALARRHQISTAALDSARGLWQRALATDRRLSGTRALELGAVIENLREIAAARELTASRLPALLLTLERNREWWTSGSLLASGDRVEFAGSQIVWEYYAGQGIELQVLGTFGKADGLYTAGPAHYGDLRALLAEMIPLASSRGGGLTWEYEFQYAGGLPPWTSAMSQATGVEALTRAAAASRAQGDPAAARKYLATAKRALAIFRLQPPTGVAVPTSRGTRFLEYSFAPQAAVINAFLQTLIGLYDYARASGDPSADALFAAGDAEARSELPQYDTGAWSLYEPGQEDSLDYHELVTGFLHQLCQRTAASAYCTTAQHFDAYLKTPPALSALTTRVPRGTPALVRFSLSKISHVGIVILHGSRTVFLTSAYFSHGVGAFAVPPITQPGTYTLHLAATDLAGNFTRIIRSLKVTAAP